MLDVGHKIGFCRTIRWYYFWVRHSLQQTMKHQGIIILGVRHKWRMGYNFAGFFGKNGHFEAFFQQKWSFDTLFLPDKLKISPFESPRGGYKLSRAPLLYKHFFTHDVLQIKKVKPPWLCGNKIDSVYMCTYRMI